MGVVREMMRNWLPIVVLGVVGFMALMFGTRLARDVWTQHKDKVEAREDAEKRVRLLCKDAKLVYETNYGETCRKYLLTSQTVPIWEAWCAVADSYRLCDARTGCSGAVIMLLMCLPAMLLVMYALYRGNGYYRNMVHGFNDHEDAQFMFGGGGVFPIMHQRQLQAFHANNPKID